MPSVRAQASRDAEQIVTGELVTLRMPRPDDAQAIAEYAGSREGLEGVWLPLRPGAAPLECEALINDWLAGWQGDASAHGAAFVVCEALGSRLVGQIGWRCRGKEGLVELVYGIAPPYRGRGFASEGARLAGTWLLAQQVASSVELRIDPSHRESQRVAEKAGFQLTGTLRSYVAGTGESYEDLRYVLGADTGS